MDGFDYRTATEEEILERAALLEGMRVGDLPGVNLSAIEAKRGKGEIGHAIEAYFGIPRNARRDPDFPGAGIELKVVPLVATDHGLRVKERTVVSLIDYDQIVAETWETASIRKKLRILFVFFEHLHGRPKADFPIHGVLLWEPSAQVEDEIRRDWETVQAKVGAGLAHELSEADANILGPCTKAPDSSSLRRQPYSDVRAKPRAFALKPWFTYALYADLEYPLNERHFAETATLRALRRRFQRYVGRTIEEVGAMLEVKRSSSKSYAATVVHEAVIEASSFGEGFKRVGPTVRMSRVDASFYPYEALSFPSFRHFELIEETWESSDLLARIEHMLIVPVFGRTRHMPPGDCVIKEPIYWRPTAEQLQIIQQEWTMFRDLIGRGKADSLPKGSQTSAIHVRPHGRNAADRDPTPGGASQTRKSFWLNRRFVQSILA